MKSGQEDVFTFLKLKFQNIDVKSIQEEVLKEIEKI
jgi:predicted solute-binding protein